MRVKVLSWNIWIDGYFGQVKEFLERADADIIGLQEVRDDDPERNVIGFLKGIGYDSVFAPVEKGWGGKVFRDGPAVFSRLPILGRATHRLSGTEGRAAAQADIGVGSAVLHAFSTHLLHTHQKDSAVQNQQAENLLGLLPTEKTVLMGDFNALPDSVPVWLMRETLVDTDPSDWPTWSVYPAGCPVCAPAAVNMRLDYIFMTPDFHTETFGVGVSDGSDHLPVSATIAT